ncbi:gasdermin-C [Cavia porcellus]|uniref:gasdermin-C n=1 Tax=Cavia porcellus TaxID=10141 RepID=UPI002FE41C27
MASIFEQACKNMIKDLGGKDMRPVTCALDANKFRQFSLIRKKPQFFIWEHPDDFPVGYSLMQILEPNSSIPDSEITKPLCIMNLGANKMQADVGIHAGVEANVLAEVSSSHGSTLEIQNVSIRNQDLENLQNRKLLDPEPSFLRECRRRGDNLYVVTEAVELTKDSILYDNGSVTISGMLSSPQFTFIKGGGQYQGRSATKMTVHRGMVMAYRMKKLVIKDKHCSILVIDDKKQKTFQQEKPQMIIMHSAPINPGNVVYCAGTTRKSSESLFVRETPKQWTELHSEQEPTGELDLSLILPLGRLEEPFGQDFPFLQDEVSGNVEALAQVSKDQRAVILHSILSMLGDREALKDLLDKLEMENLGHLEGPGGRLLQELRQEASPRWVDLEHLTVYLLEVLMVLSDHQLLLLVQSVEKRILLPQRELVRSILEPNFKYPWHIPFTLQAELLAPLQGEDLQLTYALLVECDLKMALESRRSTWHLGAKKPLSALYVALSVLLKLAEA